MTLSMGVLHSLNASGMHVDCSVAAALRAVIICLPSVRLFKSGNSQIVEAGQALVMRAGITVKVTPDGSPSA